MASSLHDIHWTTSKASRLSTHDKSKETVPKLYQSSLHDFIKRKPKCKQVQKENRSNSPILKPTKRKQSGTQHNEEEGIVKKKRKRHEEASQGLMHERVVKPLLRSKDLVEHCPSPFGLTGSREVISWDDTTVWDSATSSPTIDDTVALTSCSPKETVEITKMNSVNTSVKSVSTPGSPTAARWPQGRVLAPDTPNQGNTLGFNDDPFIVLSRGDALESSRDTEVVPSSQSEEIEYPSCLAHNADGGFWVPPNCSPDMDFDPFSPPRRVRSPSRIQQTVSNEVVSSSQSQYILPYKVSPIRPSVHKCGGSATAGTEIIPSSQILEELELEVYSSDCGVCSRTGKRAFTTFSAPKDSHSSTILSTSDLHGECTPTTPNGLILRRRPVDESVSTRLQNSPNSPTHSTDTQFSLLSTSPPPMASSQYGYLPNDASYPQEVETFLRMFDDDRRSLGSDFPSSLPSISLAMEGGEDSAISAMDVPSPKDQITGSPEPQLPSQLSSLPLEPIATLQIPVGNESHYTFVEESYPPAVTDFLDMMSQDHGSLGSLFGKSMQCP